MTQVLLNISSKKKWVALKAVLDAMDIDYTAQDNTEQLSETEQELLQKGINDKENGRLSIYTNNRDILGV